MKKIGGIAAVITVIVYLCTPNIMTQIETLLFLVTIFMASAYLVGIIDDQIQRIRRKRLSLRIRKQRKKIIDFKMKRIVHIPAYPVMEKDA